MAQFGRIPSDVTKNRKKEKMTMAELKGLRTAGKLLRRCSNSSHATASLASYLTRSSVNSREHDPPGQAELMEFNPQ
ncbi:hypothetical protein RRG08_034792 [Elysia crispata]|uniref:Uncharacterized protein n=1 Tax=Elysia crispata TaxID=231223 RepID=A0AAE0YA73_9GAST|nr:hypothetical protein RRG08_034792 [Elysia crispata]